MTARCDIAVVGGGLTGLLAADRLVRAGADVVLVDPHHPCEAASARALGIVALGWIDSPARLAGALGEPLARGLYAWSALAVASLRRVAAELRVTWRSTGSLRLAMDEQDHLAWQGSVELLRRWGLGGPVRGLSPDEVDALGPSDRLLGGVLVPDDALLDLSELMLRLGARFDDAGGRRLQASVAGEAGSGAPVLVSSDGSRLTAELVVAAPGAEAASLHPFFATSTYPVRLQGLRTGPGVAGPSLATPIVARHRFEAACADGDGAVAFVGCRWADRPEMGAGERDDTAVSERVSTVQTAWLRDTLGVEVGEAHRWSGIVTYTCDGLPLVGPLPGAPRIISAVGWSGWGLSLAPRAVDEICAAILGEPPPDGIETPLPLTARRLV